MIEPRGRQCELRVSLEYELPGEIVGSIFGMLTGKRIEQEFRRTYDRLKRLAEHVATEPTPFDRGGEDADDDAGSGGGGKATGSAGRIATA